MEFQSINPATGEVLDRFPETPAGEIDRILEEAHRASLAWRERPLSERSVPLRAAAQLLREKKGAFARTMALEMGKPLKQGEAEAEKCAWGCDYYAEVGPDLLAPRERATDASKSYVRFDPLGPILAVMPWNYPFWQVFRCSAPSLLAGNAVLLKHAPNVSRCALEIEGVLREAGFPPGLFRTLLVDVGAVPGIIVDRRIRGVTLTGSVRAGRAVAEAAGRSLKKTLLELGGSDPFIVLEDADLDAAARTAAEARLVNSGQSCIAAKRFIVVEGVADAFLERFARELAARTTGDPLDPATRIGPQARRDLRDRLHRQVVESIERGARLVLGGTVPPGPGAYYPPTLLVGIGRGMPAFDEEIFGPVAGLVRARDEEEAVRLANDSPYGLGASVWTRSRPRAERIAQYIEAGSVFVNAPVQSDPRLPFGGVKDSGYGRELSEFGLWEFVNLKTVWIR